MTNVALGFLGKAGIAKNTKWGSDSSFAIQASTSQILPNSINVVYKPKLLDDLSFNGLPMSFNAQQGEVNIAGDIKGTWRYSGLTALILCAMGTKSTWTSKAANNSYGDFSLIHSSSGDQFDTQFLNLDYDASPGCVGGATNQWWRFFSLAINRLTFDWKPGDYLRYTASMLGGAINQTGTSGTPVAYAKGVTAPSITIADAHQKALALSSHVKFFTADTTPTDTTAMTNADRFYPSSFQLVLDNKVNVYRTADSDPYMATPERDGMPDITGTMEFPILESNQTSYSDALEFLTDFEAQQIKKLVMSAQYLSGGIYYALNFVIPCYQFEDHSNWELVTKGRIAPRFTFKSYAHPAGLAVASIWSDTNYFKSTLASALQQVPFINVLNNETAAP